MHTAWPLLLHTMLFVIYCTSLIWKDIFLDLIYLLEQTSYLSVNVVIFTLCAVYKVNIKTHFLVPSEMFLWGGKIHNPTGLKVPLYSFLLFTNERHTLYDQVKLPLLKILKYYNIGKFLKYYNIDKFLKYCNFGKGRMSILWTNELDIIKMSMNLLYLNYYRNKGIDRSEIY